MPFPDLPPNRIPGSPGHLNDHQIIDQALDYIQQQAYRQDPDFPPLPDIPVLGQSGHVTAHDRILACLEYMKTHPATGLGWAQVSNNPTGTYTGDDGHTYAYYLFESDGTLTVTAAGLLELLLVSGGGGNNTGRPGGGVGGYIVTGLHPMDAGSVPVKVGKGGANAGSNTGTIAGRSSLGPISTGAPGWGIGTAATEGGTSTPYTSTITGTEILVSGRGRTAAYGAGGDTGQSGEDGVVIARTRLN